VLERSRVKSQCLGGGLFHIANPSKAFLGWRFDCLFCRGLARCMILVARAVIVEHGLESMPRGLGVLFHIATQVRRSWVGASTVYFVGALLIA
jgi:hypothetical protein